MAGFLVENGLKVINLAFKGLGLGDDFIFGLF